MQKTILITGSSRGIGKAIAHSFAKLDNYNIVLNGNKNEDELLNTYNELIKINPNIIKIKADVSDYQQCKTMIDKILKIFGSIDILINNAGICYYGLFQLMDANSIKNIIDTNLLSAINCSSLVLENMIANKSGNIINISSIWGEKGASLEVVYSATKGAINTFTKALAKEVGPSNIRVNAIACGLINTQMNNIFTKEDLSNFIYDIPLGKIGDCYDVAKLCLCIVDLDYLTGQIINLDGGYL